MDGGECRNDHCQATKLIVIILKNYTKNDENNMINVIATYGSTVRILRHPRAFQTQPIRWVTNSAVRFEHELHYGQLPQR